MLAEHPAFYRAAKFRQEVNVMNFKFRLDVQLFKCIDCDLLFLIEKQTANHMGWYSCPECSHLVEYMEEMTIVEEK